MVEQSTGTQGCSPASAILARESAVSKTLDDLPLRPTAQQCIMVDCIARSAQCLSCVRDTSSMPCCEFKQAVLDVQMNDPSRVKEANSHGDIQRQKLPSAAVAPSHEGKALGKEQGSWCMMNSHQLATQFAKCSQWSTNNDLLCQRSATSCLGSSSAWYKSPPSRMSVKELLDHEHLPLQRATIAQTSVV